MTPLALLLTGFSVFSALSLSVTHVAGPPYRDQPLTRAMGFALLLALSVLQLAHFALLQAGVDWTASPAYRVALFTVAPSFHLFTRALLTPMAPAIPAARLAAHALPVLAAPFIPASVALPSAFLVGTGYLLALGRDLLALRRERSRFAAEIALLGTAVLLAVGIAVLAMVPALLPPPAFHALYAIAIGLALLLVQTALGLRPTLPAEVQEVAQAAYAHSSLGKVDCDAALARLAAAMQTERLYVDPDLSLPKLAAHLDLSTHQLSELLNTRMGRGFSRYLRELRVEAAKTMLRDEPSASVLSVGLNVGFTSQSTFYDAFREVAGTTPGQYRKLSRSDAA